MTVYDSACAASFTHLQSAVRNGQTSVTVNAFVLAVMITGKIFLTGYDKQIALRSFIRESLTPIEQEDKMAILSSRHIFIGHVLLDCT